jgi:hypothetical protein
LRGNVSRGTPHTAAFFTPPRTRQVQLKRRLSDKRYGVARMTVQQALRILKDEGLTVSRQGSGVFARERTAKPVGLRPHLELAFDQEHVQIDFSGYTSETLHGAVAEPLDKIRTGRLTPKSIRLLRSDMEAPLAIPISADRDPGKSGLVRKRMAEIADRHAGAITATVEELAYLELVGEASVEVRVHGSAPLFKCYIVSGADVFFGYYPVVKHEVRIDKKRVPIFDPMGKDAVMFQHTDDGDPDSMGSLYVAQTKTWFESVWSTIATQQNQP